MEAAPLCMFTPAALVHILSGLSSNNTVTCRETFSMYLFSEQVVVNEGSVLAVPSSWSMHEAAGFMEGHPHSLPERLPDWQSGEGKERGLYMEAGAA